MASIWQDDPEVIRLLLEAGADPATMVGANAALAHIALNEDLMDNIERLPDGTPAKEVFWEAYDAIW